MVRYRPLGKKSGVADLGQAIVAETDAGQRLDRWLKGIFPNLPYIAVQKLVRLGKVRIDGVKAKADARLAAGSKVTFPADFSDNERKGSGESVYQVTSADMEMLELGTLFEDKAMLVLNKPAGLPAQAGGGQVRSLDRIFDGVYGEKAPKLVHRIDRETTGVLVSAKNRTMAAALTAQFAARETRKEYLAVIVGKLPGKSGEIKASIAKAGAFARVDKDGDKAHTTWTWLASDGELHLISCMPHTGRMNQLRVHMAHIGLPMLGDDKYGNDHVKTAGKAVHGNNIPLYLHAWKLTIAHPESGETLRFEAPLPAHFAAMATRMGWQVE
ncbi:MAG: RluA family pseudouridine synthase [Alphaproteobacteria bacterium]|nr:MAG: RluA family pseudouridine synthase [Alphaproteobacteria bacterium]